MELSFRLAAVADIELLLDFIPEFYEGEHLAFNEGAARAALRNILSDEGLGRLWLIQLDGISIGYVLLTFSFSLEFHGRVASIDEIYVRAEYRGQGVGSRALLFVEDACRRLGARALHLEVERDNANAQALYRKSGFEDHNRYLLTKLIAD